MITKKFVPKIVLLNKFPDQLFISTSSVSYLVHSIKLVSSFGLLENYMTYCSVPERTPELNRLLENRLRLLIIEIRAHGRTQTHGAKPGDWNFSVTEW